MNNEQALALAIEACEVAPRDDTERERWWDHVSRVAAECLGAEHRIAAVTASVAIKTTVLPGVIERCEELRTSSGGLGRGRVFFRSDRPGSYGQDIEKFTTDWLSTPEGKRVYDACVALVGCHVELTKGIVAKFDSNGQRMVHVVDGVSVPATTSRVLAVRADTRGTNDDASGTAGGTEAPHGSVPGIAGEPAAAHSVTAASPAWVASMRRGLAQAGLGANDEARVVSDALGREGDLASVREDEREALVAHVRALIAARSMATV